MSLNLNQIRSSFPALKQTIYGKPLIYFDNAATTLKPDVVIHEVCRFYEQENSNIHRGTHYLSQLATELFENTRIKIAKFINASDASEIIFVKGATEAINLVASSFGKAFVKQGDEIVISALEHHSNIVPWQMLCETSGASLKIIPILADGSLDMKTFEQMLNNNTRLIAITHVSNALGIINPISKIVELAHASNIPVLIDGAQGIVHNQVNVQQIDCDFYCFSSHKLYGPMGLGILYGKRNWLEQMPPYQGGGEMIKEVSFENTIYNDLPFKFEAGTPNVSAVAGFSKAIDFIEQTGMQNIRQHEDHLLEYATHKLSDIENLVIYGTHPHKTGVLSFLLKNIHPYDIGVLLDKYGIAVRTGHHCAQPLMQYLGIPGTVRVSFAMYNSTDEIDLLHDAIKKIARILQ